MSSTRSIGTDNDRRVALKQPIAAFLVLTFSLAAAFAQPGPITTVQNSNVMVRAATLITNGIPGLTNDWRALMISAVAGSSSRGGSVGLVKKRTWVRFYGQSNARRIVVDPVGNVIVAGTSLRGTNANFATVKYSAQGIPLWTNLYDGPAHTADDGYCLAVDAAGNVYVGGNSGVYGVQRQDIAVVKYSSNGQRLWARRFNTFGTNYLQLDSMAVDRFGNVYISPSDFDEEPRSIITLKYNQWGVSVWTNRYRASPGLRATSAAGIAIAADVAGNLFVTGGSRESFGSCYVTLKYAPDGRALWTNYLRSASPGPSAMVLDRAGNVIVTGDVTRTNHVYATVKYANNGMPAWTNFLAAPSVQGGYLPHVVTDARRNVFVTARPPNSTEEFSIVKLSRDGIPLWTNRLSHPNPLPGFGGATVDSMGNFYLTVSASDYSANYLTAKFSGNGSGLWTNRFDRYNGMDSPTSIAAGIGGDVFVTGSSNGDFATIAYADYISYTPRNNFVGTDTIRFTAVDPVGNMATCTLTVNALPPP